MLILQKTSVLCALGREVLATKAPHFTVWSLNSCARYSRGLEYVVSSLSPVCMYVCMYLCMFTTCASFFLFRVETLPTTMEQGASPSMERNFLMRTFSWSTQAWGHCPWPMQGPTQMVPSSSSAQPQLTGKLYLVMLLHSGSIQLISGVFLAY